MSDSKGAPPNWLPAFTQTKTGGRLTIVALFVLIVALIFGLWRSSGDSSASPGSPSPTQSRESAAGDAPGPVGGGAPPSEAETSSTPGPTSTSTVPPSEWDGSDAGKENSHGDDLTGTLSPWKPGSDRKPAASDQSKAKAVLSRVVPTWANADLSEDTSADAWIKTWSSLEGASSALVGESNTRYLSLWRGVIQSDASVRGSKIVSAKQLWNAGSDSLWRVTVRRQAVSNSGDTSFGGPEEITWDFQIKQDGPDGFELVNFLDPRKANEKPKTYDPEADQ